MIYAIIGDCGSGKTLLMTILAYADYLKGEKIFSNGALNFPYDKLTRAFFKNYASFPIFDATICMDELSLYYSARSTNSKQNRVLRPFILQTRKRSLKLFYTAQQMRLCDVNIRENTDATFFPQLWVSRNKGPFIRVPEWWKHKTGDFYILTYKKYDKNWILKGSGVLLDAGRFFDLYNTHEIINFEAD